MTSDRALCPPVALEARLGDRARPAGGRPPVRRFTFAACTLDAVESARQHLTATLERHVGPLRCTPVDVEVAVGEDHAAELLADLEANRGQSATTLEPLVDALAQVKTAADRLGAGDPVLVVASCGALTRQPHATVWAS